MLEIITCALQMIEKVGVATENSPPSAYSGFCLCLRVHGSVWITSVYPVADEIALNCRILRRNGRFQAFLFFFALCPLSGRETVETTV